MCQFDKNDIIIIKLIQAIRKLRTVFNFISYIKSTYVLVGFFQTFHPNQEIEKNLCCISRTF